MKPRWTSPPVTFNGQPLEAYTPRPKVKLGKYEKVPYRRKPTQAELDAVTDVTEVTELNI